MKDAIEKNNKEKKKFNINNTVDFLNAVYKIFVLLGIIAIILLIIFKPCNCDCNCRNNASNQSSTIEYDDTDDSKTGSKTTVDDLNKKVKEGEITMSMNTDPEFKNGSAEGNLVIANDNSNNYPIIVEIKTKADNKTVYKSKAIPVGKYINYAKLDVPLKKGDYPATAYFSNVDENTGKVLGTGAVEIVLHIES